ncbi:HalOD1 output domain-containing protein [Halorussus salinus]|uniref:HalOD1 output domain-containing protein n=1 Tax=Halorussus salinus TaxID=1364935 RepID=UPI0010922AD7|nr:HalOD1 output domain-containing protein [Halorussus salinus]
MFDSDETNDGPANCGPETHRVNYDPASDAKPSHALVVGVADRAGVDPLELNPLHDAVDPELIDELVGEDGLPEVNGHVSFAYAGFDVTVYPSGLFELSPV